MYGAIECGFARNYCKHIDEQEDLPTFVYRNRTRYVYRLQYQLVHTTIKYRQSGFMYCYTHTSQSNC